MRIAKILSLLGCLTMLGALVYGFTIGDFVAEGQRLLSTTWGWVTLIDIYISFFVFCGWIIYRERSWVSSIWIALVIVLGSFTICLYVFLALDRSDGDWDRFWHGHRRARD